MLVQKELQPCWNSHARPNNQWYKISLLLTIPTQTGSCKHSWKASHSVDLKPCRHQLTRQLCILWPLNPCSKDPPRGRCDLWIKLTAWNIAFHSLGSADVHWHLTTLMSIVLWREKLATWLKCQILRRENKHSMWVNFLILTFEVVAWERNFFQIMLVCTVVLKTNASRNSK